MDLLPPRWADIGDDITDLLSDVARKGQELDRLHQKHILPGFNDDEAKKVEENEIERLTQDITRGFHECHRHIQQVEQMVRESKRQGTLTRAEETMAQNIQISLATRVQEASASFRKKQSAYLKSTLPSICSRSICLYQVLLTAFPACRASRHERARIPGTGGSVLNTSSVILQ